MSPGKRRYEIQLSSKNGPIDVFIIQDINLQKEAEPDISVFGSFDSNPVNDTIKQLDFQSPMYDYELKDHEGPNDLYEMNEMLNMHLFNLSANDLE